MSAQSIANALDMLASPRADRDHKYMALSDLHSELVGHEQINIDAQLETRVCVVLVEYIRSKHNDLQEAAVKCLPCVVKLFKPKTVRDLSWELSARVFDEQSSDVVADACCRSLSRVLAEFEPNERESESKGAPVDEAMSGAAEVAKGENRLDGLNVDLMGTLLQELQKRAPSGPRVSMALDLLDAFYGAHGAHIASYHSQSIDILLPHVSSKDRLFSKKIVGCLSSLTKFLGHDLLLAVMHRLLDAFEAAKGDGNTDAMMSILRTVISIVRSSGARFGDLARRVLLLVVGVASSKDNEENCDLRDLCFQTAENVFRHCRTEDTVSCAEAAVSALCEAARYDPNFVADSDGGIAAQGDSEDDDGFGGGTDDEDDGFGGGDDDGFGGSDDDDGFGGDDEEDGDDDEDEDEMADDSDLSWKVRRSSVKCVIALLESFVHGRGADAFKNRFRVPADRVFAQLAEALMHRFSEREENIKLEVFTAYREVLRQSRPIEGRSKAFLKSKGDSVYGLLMAELAHKSTGVRVAALSVLKELILSVDFDTTDSRFKSLGEALNLRGDTAFAVALLECVVAHLVVSRAKRERAKSTTVSVGEELDTEFVHDRLLEAACHESLDVAVQGFIGLQELLLAMKKANSSAVVASTDDALLNRSFDVCQKALAGSRDQRLSNAALRCAALIFEKARFSDRYLALLSALEKFVDFEHEETRVNAVQAIGKLYECINQRQKSSNSKSSGGNGVDEDFPPGLVDTIPSFLRQSSDPLKETTVSSLDAMLKHNSLSVLANEEKLKKIVSDVCQLLRSHVANEALAARLLKLVETVIQTSATLGVDQFLAISGELLERVLSLCESAAALPLVDGIVSVFRAFGQCSTSEALRSQSASKVTSVIDSLGALFLESYTNVDKGALAPSIADSQRTCATRSAGAMIRGIESESAGEGEKLLEGLQAARPSDSSEAAQKRRVFALNVAGEARKSGNSLLQTNSDGFLSSAFEQISSAQSSAVRDAAATSLGAAVAGALRTHPDNHVGVEFLLEKYATSEVPAMSKSLLSVIEVLGESDIQSAYDVHQKAFGALAKGLLDRSELKEAEDIEDNAKCLGKLIAVNLEVLGKDVFDKHMDATSERERVRFIKAANHFVADSAIGDGADTRRLNEVLSMSLESKEIENLLSGTKLAHDYLVHRGERFAACEDSVMNAMLSHAKLNPEWVKTVKLGPITKQVDDGIPLREAVFRFLSAYVESGRIGVESRFIEPLLEAVVDGISDDTSDVAFLAHQLLIQVIETGYLEARAAGPLVAPLRAEALRKVKENAVQHEVERHKDRKSAVLRSVDALRRGVCCICASDDAGGCADFRKLVADLESEVPEFLSISST